MRDAAGVRNVAAIIERCAGEELYVVVSAMGKMTNAFEALLEKYMQSSDYESDMQYVQRFHLEICEELFPSHHAVFAELERYFVQIENLLEQNRSQSYSFVYDQLVVFGELLSTTIVSQYLAWAGVENTWLDAREIIRTSADYREGKVDWALTCSNLQQVRAEGMCVIQGFIGSDENYFSTTLGREGSDYTGAILAYCLDAESLTIWKDVAGVLNADPRYFEETHLLQKISYEEAIELAYYGASIIHPKTLQPLQRKKIPLYVRSFEREELPGSVITEGAAIEPLVPCFIVKKGQTVVRVATKDFSFIDEEILQKIFDNLSKNKLKVNLMQISAISVLLCVEDKYSLLATALKDFEENFVVQKYGSCSLYTIRHGAANSAEQIERSGEVLIHQQNGNTLQLVIQA